MERRAGPGADAAGGGARAQKLVENRAADPRPRGQAVSGTVTPKYIQLVQPPVPLREEVEVDGEGGRGHHPGARHVLF